MLRPVYRCCVLASVFSLGTLASARPATASDPFTTYVVPSRVEMQPTEEAATRVVIHGAFFNLTSATEFTYSDAKCGVMYFQCVAGQEAMCRMQWKELATAIEPAPTLCRGFGNKQVVTTATMYVEGEPLGTPDPWDLGMGIGLGAWVDNKCVPATKLSCPPAGPGSGGAGGAGGAEGTGGAGGTGGGGGAGVGGDAGGAGGSGGAGGAGGGGGSAGAAGGTAGAAGTAGTAGAAGTRGAAGAGGAAGGETPLVKSGPGCALAGGATRPGPAAIFALLGAGALVAAVRARRRR
jgi:hypothetical protein